MSDSLNSSFFPHLLSLSKPKLIPNHPNCAFPSFYLGKVEFPEQKNLLTSNRTIGSATSGNFRKPSCCSGSTRSNTVTFCFCFMRRGDSPLQNRLITAVAFKQKIFYALVFVRTVFYTVVEVRRDNKMLKSCSGNRIFNMRAQRGIKPSSLKN